MSAFDLDPKDKTAAVPLSRKASSGRRTKKRWSFHDAPKPDFLGGVAASEFRRRPSDVTGLDGVHAKIDPAHISPAQLYSTESGRLFHAGKICIALTGLPARGKTHLSVSLTRYLRWLGVKTHSFHLGDYRRAASVTEDLDYTLSVGQLQEQGHEEEPSSHPTVDECLNDILRFFAKDKGQVAVYDAVNAVPEHRQQLAARLRRGGIHCLFIESAVLDAALVRQNIAAAARSSPDYTGWDYEKAFQDYSERIRVLEPHYRTMDANGADAGLSFIRFIDLGQRIEMYNSNYGYLVNKVVFFLMNSRIKSGSVYFARCWKNEWAYSEDPPLDDEGLRYARNITHTMLRHLSAKGRQCGQGPGQVMRRALSIDEKLPPTGADGVEEDSFVVWTSVKKRTVETTRFFREVGIKVRPRIQLSQKNPGVVAGMTDKEISTKYSSEHASYLADPYHHRFSRAESYHDLAIKIEPLILEMERMSGDILIIADESVLRVLHGYLMACSCYDIPWLQFSSNDIIEVKFNAYSNTARRIPIQEAPESQLAALSLAT